MLLVITRVYACAHQWQELRRIRAKKGTSRDVVILRKLQLRVFETSFALKTEKKCIYGLKKLGLWLLTGTPP